MEEEIVPKSDTLSALVTEDLELLGLEELEERISLLKTEIERVKAVLESKKGSRADAEALFKA
jgi:uncharacterized small protein (DUF1192 family)